MKKAWYVVALAVLMGMAMSTYAEVQNIRLSGDIRVRGYYLMNTSVLENSITGSGNCWDDYFITQRTRVTVEADLEDHVMAVVTLRAEGVWGGANESLETTGGAGLPIGPLKVNRGWDVGINEAYVQFNEMFYSPVTLKLGRQYLNYGKGLIFSNVDQEYNFDAARLVLDLYPFTLDLVYARAFEGSVQSAGNLGLGSVTGFIPGATGGDTRGMNLVFGNAKFEFSDSIIKGIEAYAGLLANGMNLGTVGGVPLTTAPWVLPSVGGASPVILGARADLALTEGLNVWAEGAYECGSDGELGNDGISAFLANAGLKFALPVMKEWTPMLNAGYTVASGGGGNGTGHYFRPWFDYVDGYNGYLFHPALSNIQIINLGGSIKPWENTSLALQGYYYMKYNREGVAFSNPNVDTGVTGAIAAGSAKHIGWELDSILTYDYSKDVRCQLVYAVFLPGRDLHEYSDWDAVAMEVRGEVSVKF